MAFIQAKANGTIYPCRFVSVYPATSNADGFKVIEDIVVAQPIIGVSQQGTTGFPMSSTNDMGVTAPTAAALDEQEVMVFAVGEQCLIELAGTVNAGDYIKANATTDGKGVVAAIATASQQFVGGIALQYGVSGEKIRMLVQPGIINNGT
jgi:hypothetical protein